MSPGLPDPHTVLNAVDIYLALAYPAGLPPKIRTIVGTLQTSTTDFYLNPNFIRGNDPQRLSYYLRLGNAHYPHAKLLIEPWLKELIYVFRVDTHDQHISVARDNPEFDALCELRRKNKDIAGAIESAWQAAGIPTLAECFEQKASESLHAAV